MDRHLFGKPDVEKAKAIVCAIVLSSGGRFEGKTKLNKVFWWAHVHSYRNNPGFLSRYPIARLPEGPAIDDVDRLLVSMERDGLIEQAIQDNHGHAEHLFTLTDAGRQAARLCDDEMASIEAAVHWALGKRAVDVSRESHRTSRSWMAGNDGDLLDIANDALSDEDFRQTEQKVNKIEANLGWADSIVANIFGEDRVGPAR